MSEEYKYPEYKPYSTYSREPPTNVFLDYAPSIEELIIRLTSIIEEFNNLIADYRNSAASKAIMNTGRDELLNLSIRDMWDEGTELPLLIYEAAAGSENARHQYVADVALEASRGVSGDYSLDAMDIYKIAQAEAVNMLGWLKAGGLKNFSVVWSSAEIMTGVLENILYYEALSKQYKKMNLNYYQANKTEVDPVVKATEIQKNIHSQIATINSALSTNKKTLIELSRTSESFYGEKVKSLDTAYDNDGSQLADLLYKRAGVFDTANSTIFQVISAGASLKETWREQSEISNISISNIAQQAYVNNSPSNLTSANDALNAFVKEISEPLSDSSLVFVRRQGYTEEDAHALVEMLNMLPETYTYIRAGLISVRAEEKFVRDLIDQINSMPSNSTLISGGMIALTGDKTLTEFQEEVESGAYGGGIDDVQQVVDVLNESVGGSSGLTILLPGVIGLTGNEGIREAIVDSINTFEEGTLIGPGAILVSGGDSLEDKADVWDSASETAIDAAADATQALQDAADAMAAAEQAQATADGQIVGFLTATEPVEGMSFGDIWIDIDGHSPPTSDDIYRYEYNTDEPPVLDWISEPTNGVGLAYLTAYNAQLTANNKIVTFYVEGTWVGSPAVRNGPTALEEGDLWVDLDDENKLYRAAAAGANEVKAGEWVLIRDEGITQALDELANTQGLLSYFGITDTTLIDGGKVYTSGVLVDFLLSGMSEAGSAKSFNISSGNYDTIDVGLSTRIREVRSTSEYSWPALSTKMKYKVAVSIDNVNYSYIRGTAGAYAELLRSTYTDNESTVHDTPMVFILEGNHVRYIRITFGGFYQADDTPVAGSFATDLQAYGALAFIDGGQVFASSLLIGAFDQTTQDMITDGAETATNFSSRNDRIATVPATPVAVGVTRELNTDGTSNLIFEWTF